MYQSFENVMQGDVVCCSVCGVLQCDTVCQVISNVWQYEFAMLHICMSLSRMCMWISRRVEVVYVLGVCLCEHQ